jgi:predicted O-methyltransferase YrrM
MAETRKRPQAPSSLRQLVMTPMRFLRRVIGTDPRQQGAAAVSRIDVFEHQLTIGYLAPINELLDLALRRLNTLEGGVEELQALALVKLASLEELQAFALEKLASLEEQVSLLRTHLNASGVMGPMNRKTKELESLFRQVDAVALPGAGVVEVGCMRYPFESPTEGASTLYFARWCGGANRPFISVDTEKEHLDTARKILEAVEVDATLIQARGEDVLAALKQAICLLYLDGSNEPAETLAQFRAAEDKMAPGCVVAIDDVQQIGGHAQGKGTAAIPYARSKGWNVRIMATEPGYRMAILRQGDAEAN